MKSETRVQHDRPEEPRWPTDHLTQRAWRKLIPGTSVTILKRSPSGENRVRYPGIVVPSTLPLPWIEVEARWTNPTVVQAQLAFEPGDILREIFSPAHPFNAFAIYRPIGELKGWYANITYPTTIDESEYAPVVIWHDLFIDIVASPDGEVAVLDEDELDNANPRDTSPELHERILAARDELLERFHDRRAPFHESKIETTQSNG